MKTASLRLRTPEGILFSQQLAGPLSRFFAWSIDLLCIAGLLSALSYALFFATIFGLGAASAFITVGYFVISIGYAIFLEWFWRGQTIGKKLLGLRVVDADGLRLQFDQIVTRNLIRFVDSLPFLYFVGGISCWMTSRCQRLGDIAGNTVVVRIPKVSEPRLDELLAGKFNSLRQHPHLAARLRQSTSPDEASLAAAALLRREELTPESRLELYAQLATHFREKVKFPQEATDGLSDEQYIRNVVDVMYN